MPRPQAEPHAAALQAAPAAPSAPEATQAPQGRPRRPRRGRGRQHGEVYVGLGDEVNVLLGSGRVRRLRRSLPPDTADMPEADALAYSLLLDAGGDPAEAARLARRFRGLVLRPHLARRLWRLPAARITDWLHKHGVA